MRLTKNQKTKNSLPGGSYRALLVTAFAFLTVLGMPVTALAKTSTASKPAVPAGSIAVSPGQLNFTLANDGASQTVPVILHNSYTKDVTLTAALQGIDENGGRLIPVQGLDPVFASSLAISETEFTIPARGSYQIQVQSTATASLSPGGHYATLVLTQQGENKDTEPAYKAALSLSIFVVKSIGAKQDLRISGLQAGHWIFALPSAASVTFVNKGNIHTVPHASVMVVSKDGRTVYEKGLVNETSLPLLPGKSLNLTASLSKLVTIWEPRQLVLRMDYQADGDAGPKTVTQTFWYVPAIYPLAIIVLVLLAWYFRKQLTLRRLQDTCRRIIRLLHLQKFANLTRSRFNKPKNAPTTEVIAVPRTMQDITPQAPRKKRKSSQKIVITDDSES